jgi:hypothetical protein
MAGTGFNFWISIEFIGLAAISGIIGHLAVQYFNKLSKKIISFIKKPSHRFQPIITKIKISYDDLDIKIYYVDENIIGHIFFIMKDIMNEINNGGLKECKSNRITMPMENRNGEWRPFFIEESENYYEYPFRFWDICSRNINGCFGIYDFKGKEFVKGYYLTENT